MTISRCNLAGLAILVSLTGCGSNADHETQSLSSYEEDLQDPDQQHMADVIADKNAYSKPIQPLPVISEIVNGQEWLRNTTRAGEDQRVKDLEERMQMLEGQRFFEQSQRVFESAGRNAQR